MASLILLAGDQDAVSLGVITLLVLGDMIMILNLLIMPFLLEVIATYFLALEAQSWGEDSVIH